MSIDFKSINRHRGDFTKKARAAGMGVQEYAGHVLADTGSYDTRTVRQASFAKAAKKFKHAFGGSINLFAGDGDETRTSDQYMYSFPDRTEILPPYRAETNHYADPHVNGLELYDGKTLKDSFKDYYASNNRPLGFGDMKDIELSRRLASGEYGVREEMRNKITGNVKPGTVPEPYDNSGSLAEYATRHGMIDYGDGVGSDGLLMQHWNSFNVDRAKSVWSHLKGRGLTDGQAAALVAALYDESPLGPYQYEWKNEKTGKGENERTVQAYGALHFTDDSKWGAKWATRFKDWLKKSKRENDAESAVDFWLDEYLPAQERKYRERWDDANISGREMSDLMFRDLQRGMNANDSDFLARKGEIYDMILDAATADAAQRAEVESYNPNTMWNGKANLEPEYYAAGGELAHSHGAWWPNGLQFVNAGGTHEQNPNMGVQVGVDGEGTPNLVEEGEVIYNDYVFSNRLYPTRKELEEANLPVSYAKKTFAYIAERMGRESEERPNDAISRRGLEAMLKRLAGIQERQRQERGLVGSQQMEQGAGMPQGPEGMPQGMSPEDMLAMQGGGQVPPEMLAQAAGGAGYGQPEGYAPEGGEDAPEGYGGGGYAAAYGGPLVSVFRNGGHKRNGNARTDFTSKEMENDDYARDGNGMRLFDSEKGQEIYNKKYRKKFNRVIGHMDKSVLQHGIGSRSYDDILHSLYGGQGQTGDENGITGDEIIGPSMRAEPDEFNGGELDGAVVIGSWPNHNKWYGANERLKTEDNDGKPYPLLEPGTLNGGIMRPGWQVDRLEVNNTGDLSAFNGTYFTTEKESERRGNYKRLAKTDAVRDATGWVRGQIDRGAEGKSAETPPHIDAYGGNIYALGSPVRFPIFKDEGEHAGWGKDVYEGIGKYLSDPYNADNVAFINGLDEKYRTALFDWMAKNRIENGASPLPTKMRYASVMGPAVSSIVNAFRRPDNSEARGYESIAANVPNVSVRPRMLSTYMPYSPLSREYALNAVRAQTGATRRANVGLNAGQQTANNLALNYQAVPLMGQALAQTDAQNLERMKAVYDFNRQTDMTNAQNDLAAQTANANNALTRYNLVSSLRSQAAKARSQERADLEEARTQSLAGLFNNLGAIGKENLAYNQAVSSNMYYNPLTNGVGVYVGGPDGSKGNGQKVTEACGGMLTRRKRPGRARR